MADKLTVQQAQAVANRGGRLLVSAAAGSGKTKVLVDRILSYLTDPDEPANLDDFLIITYTKAAASELRGKIAAGLTERIAQEPENRRLQSQMQRLFLTKISTVHGFCSDLLREYAYRLDIAADFRVADENECRELRDTVLSGLLDRAYETAGTDESFYAFVDSQGFGRDDRLVPQLIEQVYDSARCHLNPNGWLEDCLNPVNLDQVRDASETVWGKFLIADLHSYLDCQLEAMKRCVACAEACPGLEKAAGNLRSIIWQMEALRGAETWDAVAERRNIDFGRLTFPRKNVDSDLCDRIKATRNACKKGLERKLGSFSDSSDQVLQDLAQSAAGARGLVKLVKQFEQDYQAAKRSRRCLDFSDLEHKTLDLLLGKSRSGPTAAALEIGRRFREILVDEYQDSNGVQDAIFMALTGERQNCFLVGDVKQSIYQFRLADPEIFLKKYRDYVPAEDALPGQGRKVLLSHNFRSGPEVIEGVNAVFRTCMRPSVGGLYYGEAEALREGVPQSPLPEPGVELCLLDVREDTYEEEAAFVAEKIQTMLREGTPVRKNGALRPVEPEDIVIVLRSPGSAGGSFQRALEARGIRCSCGGTNLLQAEEIETFRAFLQTIWNPRQDIPLLSILASPVFGFTADDLAALRGEQKEESIYDALLHSGSEKAGRFLHILETLRRESRMNTLTGLLERCLSLTRMDSIYAAMPDGEARSANLQAFYQLAIDFEKDNLRDLSQFLEHLTALEERGLITSATVGGGGVSIMSIHKSKGLEFPVVFLCNLSRRFNQESLRGQLLCDRELGLGLSVADHTNRVRYPSVAKRAIAVKMAEESVSEEMRVLYVAMTRARDRLILTYASHTLEKDLSEMVLRQAFDDGELLCREAVCLGDWVLLAASRRTEAGALHALGGRPSQTESGEYPWRIRVVQAPQAVAEVQSRTAAPLPEESVGRLKSALTFRYRYPEAVQAPSKQTATGRKGRVKDAEAAENTREPKPPVRTWRQPAFISKKTEGKDYGSAIHAAMQYLRYENCGNTEAVTREIARLVECEFLTAEQGSLIHCEKIARFFSSEIGVKLRTGTPYLREFKFSILDDGRHYGEGLDGEQVLLQGVVDCALLEPDGITVVDFKTDAVTEQTVAATARRYRSQVQTYGEVLSRIYEKPIKAQYLYFFRLDRLVPLD